MTFASILHNLNLMPFYSILHKSIVVRIMFLIAFKILVHLFIIKTLLIVGLKVPRQETSLKQVCYYLSVSNLPFFSFSLSKESL